MRTGRRTRTFESLGKRELLDGSGLVTAANVGNPPVIDEFLTEVALYYPEGTIDLGRQFATDVEDDAAGVPLTWSIGTADEQFFSMTPDGHLRFLEAPNFEMPVNEDNFYPVEMIVTDSDGNTAFLVLSIFITDVSESPSIDDSLSGIEVDGNTAQAHIDVVEGNTSVANLVASDDEDDLAGTPLIWSLSGEDAGLFEIAGGQLSFSDAPIHLENGENTYSFDVTVEDSARRTDSRSLLVTVTSEGSSEPPTDTAPQLAVTDNVAEIVGADVDEVFVLTLGSDIHVLTVNEQEFQFDATLVDTFHIGSGLATSHDTITVVGTELDDVASAFGDSAEFSSSSYQVNTYTFDQVTFDGAAGNDYAQLYGSNEVDLLEGLPQASTLITPTHVYQVLDFERVDSYGRGGDDYAQVYGTNGNDTFNTHDGYEVLRGAGHQQTTKGFSRVDAYGRGGTDTANLLDSLEDDYMYAFEKYVVMQSVGRKAVTKGFAQVSTEADRGGNDSAFVWNLKSVDELFATGVAMAVTRPHRTLQATHFENVDARVESGQSPLLDLADISFAFSSNLLSAND